MHHCTSNPGVPLSVLWVIDLIDLKKLEAWERNTEAFKQFFPKKYSLLVFICNILVDDGIKVEDQLWTHHLANPL